MTIQSDLVQLLKVSADVGSHFSLIQGGGGNTSVKHENILAVKGSGVKLGKPLKTSDFVCLDLDACQRSIDTGHADNLSNCIIEHSLTSTDIRPSIETALHALIPHKFIIHTHPFNTIAAVIQPELRREIEHALEGLRWSRLPYARPGGPLASTIKNEIAATQPDIILLENHGLVVGANSAMSGLEITLNIEERLHSLMRRDISPNKFRATDELKNRYLNDEAFELAPDGIIQALAFDESCLKSASKGTLYPDHVVFLGPGVAVMQESESVKEAAKRAETYFGTQVRTIVVPNEGVIVTRSLSESARDMLLALANIAIRVRFPESVESLSYDQEQQLINWDAEQYRINKNN